MHNADLNPEDILQVTLEAYKSQIERADHALGFVLPRHGPLPSWQTHAIKANSWEKD